MTELQVRNRFVKTAESYWGFREDDGSHRAIIDIYNSQTILPRNYKVTYTDAWCATFVSAIGVLLGWSDIILPECGCGKMIELYKAAGRWEERDDYTPKIGDIIMYDWDDNGTGDNTGAVEHVGIVVDIDDNRIKIIEGNKNNAVEYRELAVNGKFIRGYCLPNFIVKSEEKEEQLTMCEVKLPILKKGMKNQHVKMLQTLLIANDCDCGSYGADGDFGSGTLSALKSFQTKKNLKVDGICDADDWMALI